MKAPQNTFPLMIPNLFLYMHFVAKFIYKLQMLFCREKKSLKSECSNVQILLNFSMIFPQSLLEESTRHSSKEIL